MEPLSALRRTGLVDASDLYLIGSRARSRAGPASDWDFVAFVESDPGQASFTPFSGPPLPRSASLDEIVAWRARRPFGGVDLDVLGPAGREHRERLDLSIWTWELERARLLQEQWGHGEAYREDVRRRWEAKRDVLAAAWWARFRLQRGASAAALAREDRNSCALTLALAVRAGGRTWLLGAGQPYPPDKWLIRELPDDVADILRTLLHDARFARKLQALHELSSFVESAVDADALGDWWDLLDPEC